MKILKTILISMGVLFIGFMCVAIYISYSSSKFLGDNEKFIKEFTYDLSESWNLEKVYPRLSNDFIKGLSSPNGMSTSNTLKLLGKLEKTSDFELMHFNTGTAGAMAVVTFKAVFENGKGVVTISVVENEGKVLVQRFNVDIPDGISTRNYKREA